jgi:predicted membrane channel-forming protein YqfA (hemolysin III family)
MNIIDFIKSEEAENSRTILYVIMGLIILVLCFCFLTPETMTLVLIILTIIMFVYTYGMTLYANIKGDYAFYKYKRDKK